MYPNQYNGVCTRKRRIGFWLVVLAMLSSKLCLVLEYFGIPLGSISEVWFKVFITCLQLSRLSIKKKYLTWPVLKVYIVNHCSYFSLMFFFLRDKIETKYLIFQILKKILKLIFKKNLSQNFLIKKREQTIPFLCGQHCTKWCRDHGKYWWCTTAHPVSINNRVTSKKDFKLQNRINSKGNI